MGIKAVNGKVYLTGGTRGLGTTSDLLTIACNPQWRLGRRQRKARRWGMRNLGLAPLPLFE